MAIVRWNPYSEIDAFRTQLDRLFNEMAAANTSIWKPAIELHNAEDHFVLKVQLPGLEAKDIEIEATRDSVMLKGTIRQNSENEKNNRRYSEFYYGTFQRTVKLPIAIQNERVQADFQNGILTLTLPKVEEAVNRVVKVNLDDRSDSTENQAQ